MNLFCFLILEDDGSNPDNLSAAYCSLVYHMPAGTAHSKETNFPTNFST